METQYEWQARAKAEEPTVEESVWFHLRHAGWNPDGDIPKEVREAVEALVADATEDTIARWREVNPHRGANQPILGAPMWRASRERIVAEYRASQASQQ